MPSPARTSTDAIVAAGRRILEEQGLEALTMQAVAAAVGVRAPSLYKRLSGREELLRRIATAGAAELGARLDEAAASRDPRSALAAVAAAYRAYAHEHPRLYGLLFSPPAEDARIDDRQSAAVSATVLGIAEALAGPERALDAARVVTAWAHGFVSMELAGTFRLGGDVDAAFEYGVATLTAAIDAGRPAEQGPSRG